MEEINKQKKSSALIVKHRFGNYQILNKKVSVRIDKQYFSVFITLYKHTFLFEVLADGFGY